MTYSIGGRIRRLAASGAAVAAASLAVAVAPWPCALEPGPFVIGDQNVQVGSQVTFWGAQWWKDNPLSTGLAPAAFKGSLIRRDARADRTGRLIPATARIRRPRSADVITAIVSSQITKTGSVISGDTTEVVDVQVDPVTPAIPAIPALGPWSASSAAARAAS